LALLAVAAGVAALGCGDEPAFDAAGFAAAANEHGAGLELGSELTTTEEGKSVHAIAFEEPPGAEAGGAGADPHGHGGGSLTVTEDDAAGLAEYQRCESAATLICFRAANVAIAIESEAEPEQLARLRRAIAALGDG
jgi:hypothetical protein